MVVLAAVEAGLDTGHAALRTTTLGDAAVAQGVARASAPEADELTVSEGREERGRDVSH